MLRPNKHSDPNLTVLPIAGELLKKLRKKGSLSIAEMQEAVVSLGNDRLPLFLPALLLLYSLGQIQYRRKTDSMEYTGK